LGFSISYKLKKAKLQPHIYILWKKINKGSTKKNKMSP